MTLDTRTVTLNQDDIKLPGSGEFDWSESHVKFVVKLAFDESDLDLGEQKNFRNFGCGHLSKGVVFSKAAYIETDSGYFHISEDMMQHINVTYSRWD